jgi:hypothetical protein
MADTSSSGNVVTGGGMAGAITTVAVWGLKKYFNFEIPPEIVAAMTTILIGVGGWIARVCPYFVNELAWQI